MKQNSIEIHSRCVEIAQFIRHRYPEASMYRLAKICGIQAQILKTCVDGFPQKVGNAVLKRLEVALERERSMMVGNHCQTESDTPQLNVAPAIAILSNRLDQLEQLAGLQRSEIAQLQAEIGLLARENYLLLGKVSKMTGLDLFAQLDSNDPRIFN